MNAPSRSRDSDSLRTLAELIGHRFADEALLRRAITHPSALSETEPSYERLEFLGDRVLGLVIADRLMQRYPEEAEGDLSRRHTALVRSETLAGVAADIGLGDYLIMARGEDEAGGRQNPALLADACEAVIAALYRDGGLPAAAQFIDAHWLSRMEADIEPPLDAKTALQEWAQARGRPVPCYRVLDSKGPDHSPTFTVEARGDGLPPAKGSGPSKRAAEQAAAAMLLESTHAHPDARDG